MFKLRALANVGASGLNTDIAPWDLPEEFITAGRNFRVSNGAIISSGGWKEIPSGSHPNLELRKALHTRIDSSDMTLLAGNKGAYSWDGVAGSTLYSCAPVDGMFWSFARMGGIPIANHPDIGAFYWNPVQHAADLTSSTFKPLPFDRTTNWDTPSVHTGRIIRAHKTRLLLLNLNEGNIHMPDSFRWSHTADINSIPPTWDETDQFFSAGLASLGSNSGAILDGLSMRDSFVIYSESSINILEESYDDFVWRRRELTSYTGILAMDCVCEVKGAHFFMTPEDIMVNDGNAIDSIIHGKIKKHYIANVSSSSYKKAFCVSNIDRKEVWFCVPSQTGTGDVDLAYIYNWKDSSWAIRDLYPNTVFGYYGANGTGLTSWDNTTPKTWNDATTMLWSSDKANPFDDTVLGISSDNRIFDMDPTSFSEEETNGASSGAGMIIERTGIPLGDNRGVTTITRVYPHFKGAGTIRMELGSQDYPGSPIRWQPPYDFPIGAKRKVDQRTTGALHCFRFSLLTGGSCIFSGMEIEYSEAGLR